VDAGGKAGDCVYFMYSVYRTYRGGVWPDDCGANGCTVLVCKTIELKYLHVIRSARPADTGGPSAA